MADGSTLPATSGKASNRHGFIYRVIRRDVTPEDRTRDKGDRRYRTLHAYTRNRKDGIARPDSTYSTYEARYPLDKVDEVEEAGLGPEPLEPWERLVDGAVVAADDDPNIPYTDFDSLDSYDDILDLERIEVLSCRNKLDPKMLDLILDPLFMSEEAWRTQIEIREGIVADMKDENTPLGKIVSSIAGFENSGRGSGAELRSHLVEFANAVAMRFAGSPQESTEQHGGGTFQSGNSFRYFGYDMANKVYIGFHDVESSGFEDVSFGEVKVSMAADLKDSLLGRVLVQLRRTLQKREVVGRAFFFTLCGPVLRLWHADCIQYGTSAGYSFANREDYGKIVDIVAFLSGPAHSLFEQWKPPRADSAIAIRSIDGNLHRYKVVEIEQVSLTSQIWGPRTAVWVATVEPLSQGCFLPPNGQEMRLVIKSTWIEKHLHRHELDVLHWIQDQKESLVPEPELEPNLPLPIGFVQGETEGGIDIQDWSASADQTRMSIIATFSVPAVPLEKDIDVHTLFSIYRNLFETLDLLSRCGVHYRDLNTGNILRTIAHGPQQCVLVDFGHARILRSRRGRLEDIKRPPEPWEVNRDDYRSANEYFMCRRIHKMSLLLEHHDAYVKDYAGLKKRIEERMLTADEADVERLQGRLAKMNANIASQLEELEKASYNHRYVDDWESAIYMMLYQRYNCKGVRSGLEDLEKIHELVRKERFWSKGINRAYEIMAPYDLTTEDIHQQIDACQVALLESENAKDDPSTQPQDAGPSDGWRDPREAQCFKTIISQMREAEREFEADAARARLASMSLTDIKA